MIYSMLMKSQFITNASKMCRFIVSSNTCKHVMVDDKKVKKSWFEL